jgi:hypothetical protein
MVTFRNNNNVRRNNFRRNDRNFKNNGDRPKFASNYSNNDNFKRKVPGRNNHNASKLIEKYNDLAREASSNGDKILSENYLQHADHFTRILNEQENYRKQKFSESKSNENISEPDELAEKSTEIKTEENIVTDIKKISKEKSDTN